MLGWAREGRLLRHDCDDADFGFFREDRDKILSAIDAIIAAGFEPLNHSINNEGQISKYQFAKDGARFEFFEMFREGSSILGYIARRLRGAACRGSYFSTRF